MLSPRLDGGLRQHFINPRQGLQHHSAGLHWPCYVTTSECRALRSATSGLAWGMEPCPAPSSDHVINAEHINQLSRFHAQKLWVLNFVRFDQALFFWQQVVCEKNPFYNFVCDAQIQIPRLTGGFLYEAFSLHMIILVRLRSLFVYYATICTMLT